MSGIIVYIWRENEGSLGHASLRLRSDETYISWFPTDPFKQKCLAAQNVTYDADVSNQRNVQPVVYEMEPKVFFERRIKEWWTLFQYQNKEWIHLERNGPLVVFEALYAGNMNMEHLKKHMEPHRGETANAWTACGLERALRELLGK